MIASPFSALKVPVGTAWHVCCGLDWGSSPERGFPNPGPARFSPVHDPGGELVRVLYAGDSWECALGETVFRDLFGGGVVHTKRLDRAMLRVATTAAVVLADLRGTAARAAAGRVPEAFNDQWGGPPGTWFGAHYKESQRLARLVFDDRAAPTGSGQWDGIVWNSHQDPAQNAYLLFTDRADPLAVATPMEPLCPGWRDRVGEYASSLRVILPIAWCGA